ncbi:MAG: alpha/beta fold hydrolase [Actinomycetota bacterium]
MGLAALPVARGCWGQRPRLPTAPTLFVVGERDPIFPPAIIETAAASIPGSEVAVVENTGHSPYFERPGRWNDIVVRSGGTRRS